MTIARIAFASLLVLSAACKDKKEAAKSPEPAPAVAEPEKKVAEPTTPALDPAAPGSAAVAPATPAVVKPAGGFNTAAEYEKKANELMDKLLAVFSASGTNCEKLIAGINKFVDDNKAAIDGATAFEKANPEAEKALDEKMKARSKEIQGKLGPSAQACQSHKGFGEALSRLGD